MSISPSHSRVPSGVHTSDLQLAESPIDGRTGFPGSLNNSSVVLVRARGTTCSREAGACDHQKLSLRGIYVTKNMMFERQHAASPDVNGSPVVAPSEMGSSCFPASPPRTLVAATRVSHKRLHTRGRTVSNWRPHVPALASGVETVTEKLESRCGSPSAHQRQVLVAPASKQLREWLSRRPVGAPLSALGPRGC